MALTKVKNIVLGVTQLENDQPPYDTVLSYGESEKFKTFSTGVRVVDGPDSTFDIHQVSSTWLLESFSDGYPIFFRAANDASEPTTLLTGNPEGSTTLYWTGSERLHTTSNGIQVVPADGSGAVYIATKPNVDNGSISGLANYDSAGDLQWLTGGELSTNKFFIYDYVNSKLAFSAAPQAATELYYNGTKAFETTSTGAIISPRGAVDQTLDILNSNSSGSSHLRVGYSTGACLDIYRQGSASSIYMNTIQADSDIYLQSAGENMALFEGNGAVRLYYNGVETLRTGNSQVYLNGQRPITFNSSGGSMTIKGSAGGWATGITFNGSESTSLGSIGALGSVDTLTYLYMGKTYTDTGLRVYVDSSTYLAYDGTLMVNTGADDIRPYLDNSYDLGDSTKRWDDIYATNNVIITSDERVKTTISGSDLGLDFINELNPVSYKFKDYDSVEYNDDTEETVSGTHTFHRTHYGLIAQDVKATLSGIGKSTEEFAGYIYDADADYYALRYNEFIAPIIKAIQELTARVEALESQ